MSAKSSLESAVRNIEDAEDRLKKLKREFPEEDKIRRALRELDDAKSEIEDALRQIRNSGG